MSIASCAAEAMAACQGAKAEARAVLPGNNGGVEPFAL